VLNKKSLGAALALLAVAGLGGPAQQAVAEPTSYVLMCRGGGPMMYRVESIGTTVRIVVNFVKSPAAGTVRPPAPGECTWLDRPINGAEPHQLFVDAPGDLKVTCNSAGQCRVEGLPGALQSLINAMRSGGTFQVHVYNRGTGNFKVTRVGP
jgi:hypothetical protein